MTTTTTITTQTNAHFRGGGREYREENALRSSARVRWNRGLRIHASFDGRAAHRIEWNRHERRRTQSLNARTEWVKYKNLSYTTCTTAGVFIKSRKIIIPQSALRCLFRLKGHREALQGRPTVGLVHPFHALSVSSALLIFCAAVLLFRSPLFVKR
jgi:hypothetical protein